MDMESLRMVLDTVQSVARTAGYAGVFWIGLHYITMLFTAVGPYIAVCWMLAVLGKVAAGAYGKPKETVVTHKVGDLSFSNDSWKDFELLMKDMESVSSYGAGSIIYRADVRKLHDLWKQAKAKAKEQS